MKVPRVVAERSEVAGRRRTNVPPEGRSARREHGRKGKKLSSLKERR